MGTTLVDVETSEGRKKQEPSQIKDLTVEGEVVIRVTQKTNKDVDTFTRKISRLECQGTQRVETTNENWVDTLSVGVRIGSTVTVSDIKRF